MSADYRNVIMSKEPIPIDCINYAVRLCDRKGSTLSDSYVTIWSWEYTDSDIRYDDKTGWYMLPIMTSHSSIVEIIDQLRSKDTEWTDFLNQVNILFYCDIGSKLQFIRFIPTGGKEESYCDDSFVYAQLGECDDEYCGYSDRDKTVFKSWFHIESEEEYDRFRKLIPLSGAK